MKPEIAWNEERECEYCGKKFTPTRPQDAAQRFCCSNHRKDFFKYSGAKQKIVTAVTRVFDRKFAALEKRIVALEKKSRKALDSRSEDVITFKPEVTQ